MMEGSAPTRATTIDDLSDLQSAGFCCYCYFDGTTNQFINGSTMSYAASAWSFDDNITRYWPYSEALNFFAYAPKSLTNTYCTYTSYAEDAPEITCTNLPVAITKGSDTTQELMLAYTAAQTRAANASTGVTLNFKHPFAGICFTLDESCRSSVTVNSITIQNIYNNGTCTFDGSTASWTPTGTQTNNLVITGSPVLDSSDYDDGTYLVVPQTFASAVTFTVNATWSEWGGDFRRDVSTTVTVGSWQPGYKYTYNLVLSEYAIRVETASTYTEQW